MKALKYLSFVGKVAGLIFALNVIPFVDPTVGISNPAGTGLATSSRVGGPPGGAIPVGVKEFREVNFDDFQPHAIGALERAYRDHRHLWAASQGTQRRSRPKLCAIRWETQFSVIVARIANP